MKNNVRVIVKGIVYEKGRFLMTRRITLDPEEKDSFYKRWHFPGGGLDFGEDPEQAVKREMKEEIGVEVEVLSLIPKVFTEILGPWQNILLPFLCKIKNSELKIELNREADTFGWFSLDEIRNNKTYPFTIEMAEEAIKLVKELSIA